MLFRSACVMENTGLALQTAAALCRTWLWNGGALAPVTATSSMSQPSSPEALSLPMRKRRVNFLPASAVPKLKLLVTHAPVAYLRSPPQKHCDW